MCYNGTFRFKKLDDSFWNGETFRFADYITPPIRSFCAPIATFGDTKMPRTALAMVQIIIFNEVQTKANV